MCTRVIWIFHKNTAKYSFSLAILSIFKRSLPQPNMNSCMHQQQKYVNLIQLLWINHQKGLPLSLTIEGTVGHQLWLRLATKLRLYKLSKVNSCSKFSRFHPVEDVTTNQRLNGKSFVPRCGLELLQSEKGLEPKSSLLERCYKYKYFVQEAKVHCPHLLVFGVFSEDPAVLHLSVFPTNSL